MRLEQSAMRREQPPSLGMLPAIGFGLVACLLYGVGAGLRGDIGIFLVPLSESCGLPYSDASLCVAVMNLVFGATQPAFGMLAARTSNRFILLIGVGLLGAGLAGMSCARSFVVLLLSLGLLFGSGAGALAFGLILASAMRRVGPERAMMVSGMLNAAAGLGAFVLSPTIQSLLACGGLPFALGALLVPVAALVPVAFVVTSADPKRQEVSDASHPQEDGRSGEGLIARALADRPYVLLLAGFFTCGFHMVIIESHLFSQYVSDGIAPEAASWAFSLYGIATIFGALLSGWLSAKTSKSALLVFYYGFRCAWVCAFVLLVPAGLPSAVVFSLGLGLTGDATVSPTAGIVNERFSLAESATLIGALFLVHQIGGFMSAWLGGVIVEATGGYALLWLIDAVLCAAAALASARIRRCEAMSTA